MRRAASRLIGAAAAAVALIAGLPGAASATTTWTLQTVPLPAGQQGGELEGVSCPTATSCTATEPGDVQPPTVERWNGSAWSVQSLPYPPGQNAAAVVGISCPSPTACTATGYYITGEGNFVIMAERWNGAQWTVQATAPLPPGATLGYFTAVSCPSATSCAAVGWTSNNTTGAVAPLAERWNGSTWAVQDAQPAPGGADGSLSGVSCTSPANCTATGAYGPSGSSEVPFAQHWNGTTWRVTPVPLPSGGINGALNAVSCAAATTCTAAGWWNKGSGDTALAEVWNGSRWAAQQTARPADHKTFNAIWCTAARSCTAVGTSNARTSTFIQPLAEHE